MTQPRKPGDELSELRQRVAALERQLEVAFGYQECRHPAELEKSIASLRGMVLGKEDKILGSLRFLAAEMDALKRTLAHLGDCGRN